MAMSNSMLVSQPPGDSTHVPVGSLQVPPMTPSGSLQVPVMSSSPSLLTSSRNTLSELSTTASFQSVPKVKAALAGKNSIRSSSQGRPPRTAALLLGIGELPLPSMPIVPIRRNLSTVDLPDPVLECLDTQRQIFLQQIDDNLASSINTLREINATQKARLKRQADHVKNAYASKIDHEVKMEEVNLDCQANDELLRLQYFVASCKARLVQQASDATYKLEKQLTEDSLCMMQERVCSGAEQCTAPTLVEPPIPTVPLISAYKDAVSVPVCLVPRMAPPTVHNLESMVDSDSSPIQTAMLTPTTLAGSPQMSAASSFVPWPRGSNVQMETSPVVSHVPTTALAVHELAQPLYLAPPASADLLHHESADVTCPYGDWDIGLAVSAGMHGGKPQYPGSVIG